MVTGPINKEQLANAGFGFTGHTDFLGHLTGRKPIMAFVGGKVRVLLATVHQPLRTVSDTFCNAVCFFLKTKPCE
jgi:4-hydroxythreonine-4-phosphate dehydrogenase